MLNAVHASEAVAEAGIQRAHELVVARVVARVLGARRTEKSNS